MDFAIIIEAITRLLEPGLFLLMVGGVVAGLIFGAIPGLSGFTALAIMLPLTYTMNPIYGMNFLVAVYVGGVSGGLISAVLLGIPGTPSSISTCFDGYPLAQQGKPRKALSVAIWSSIIGGSFGGIVLIFLSPLLASFALRFSPYEYFAVILFALTTVSSLAGESMVKGLMACFFGIIFSFVGIDALSSYSRFTFGSLNLQTGFNMVPFMVGLFAVSQILVYAADRTGTYKKQTMEEKAKGMVNTTKNPDDKLTAKEFLGEWKNIIVSSAIGIVIGILPGIGGNIANLLAYGTAKNSCKEPEGFGSGHIGGIIAPEASNNASIAGAILVLLTLGIPGDNATSMLLAGFQLHGLAPGPLLFANETLLVVTIIASYMLCTWIMGIANFTLGIPVFSRILLIKAEVLYPIVIVFCAIGSFSSNTRVFDIGVMVFFGVVGYAMKKFKYPLAPMVIGFILAPLLELHLRRSLMRTEGSILPILQSPIAFTFIVLTVVVTVFTIRGEIKKGRAAQEENAA